MDSRIRMWSEEVANIKINYPQQFIAKIRIWCQNPNNFTEAHGNK